MIAHALPLLIPLLILISISWRNMRGRKLRLEMLWLYPTIMAVMAYFLLTLGPPPGPLTLTLYAAAIAGGCVVGWYRGRLTQIIVDPDTHEITSKGTAAGMLLIVLVFVARYALRYVIVPANGVSVGLGATRATDALILFAVGTMALQRIEMGVRATRLVNEARASKANADSPSS